MTKDANGVRADLIRLRTAVPNMLVAAPDAVKPGDVALFQVGRRDMLTNERAREAGETFQAVLKTGVEIVLVLPGYDNDPRELWAIPEAARYVRQFARYAGIESALDLVGVIGEQGVAFLAACGVPAPGVTLQRETSN